MSLTRRFNHVTRRPRVAVITNIISHYRVDFFRRLCAARQYDCHVFCQNAIPGAGIKTAEAAFGGSVTLVKSVSLNNEMLAWQCLPFRTICFQYDMCFIYGNPRVLSGVALSSLLRVAGVPVVIWGQAHTAGASLLSERVRLAWWRTFDYLFLYTDAEVDYLRRRGFDRHVMIGMNNGLDQQELESAAADWPANRLASWRREQRLENTTILLSCARLLSRNRFELVVESLPTLLRSDPALVWCVIGDGPERKALENRAAQRGVTRAIRWLGPLYAEEALAPWFLSSAALVHPGAIGLSLLHAFGYGLPVVTHGDRDDHMPEIAALKDGVNGVLFRRDDTASLSDSVLGVLRAPERRAEMSRSALETARREYGTAVMAERFALMVKTVQAHRRGLRRTESVVGEMR